MQQFEKIVFNYQLTTGEAEGILVFDPKKTQPQPALVMAPNWMGVTATAAELAEKVAAQGYVVLIADLYGKGRRPNGPEQALALMNEVKNSPEETAHMQSAFTALRQQKNIAIDPNKMAVFGFCFGGHNALEFARSGAAIRAAISFHGGLDTSGRYSASDINASILVLDGAQDPMIPRAQLSAFVVEMLQAKVDWKLHSYQGAVHSFTDPTAQVEGVAMYHPEVSERAFHSMFELLNQVFKH